MPDDRQKFLRKQIRRCTKRIGQALRANDHNEATNQRQQRATFAKTLAEEYDEYFILRNNKSCFVSLEEAQKHYQEPENRKKVAVARAVSEMYQGRKFLHGRYTFFYKKTPEDVKETILNEIKNQMTRMENIINKLLKDVNKAPIDFEEADKKDTNDFLDGIDMSSLL